jgi:hypothetical protein
LPGLLSGLALTPGNIIEVHKDRTHWRWFNNVWMIRRVPSMLDPVELAKGGRVDLALAKPSEPDYPQPFVTKPNDSDLQGSSKNNSAGDRQLLKSENRAKNAEPSASLNKDRVPDKSNNRDADQVLNNGQARSSSQDRFGFSGKGLRYPIEKRLLKQSTQGLQTSQSGQGIEARKQLRATAWPHKVTDQSQEISIFAKFQTGWRASWFRSVA